jgi:putative peptidoglycan lipid II flippase
MAQSNDGRDGLHMVKKQGFLSAIISASGVSIIAQGLGFVRQIMIAAYFGVMRDLDVYFTTYAIATLMVFTFGLILDSVGIPHLVRVHEEKGTAAFKALTGSIFTFSLWVSLSLSLLFVALTPLITKFMAAGFSPAEKTAVWRMTLYFVPWTLISIPYYALCSFYKSLSQFKLVFTGEIVIALVSVLALSFYHAHPGAVSLTYFLGYLSAFLLLFSRSAGLFGAVGTVFTQDMKGVIKNFLELFGANQIGSLTSIVERFFQSFLLPGGISALTYASQMTTAASSLLTFREIFIVPLSLANQRAEKLERLTIGLSVITVPVMVFTAFFAHDIVTVLFQRGKFDMQATATTASVLSVYCLAFLPSIAGLPAFRMFQVIDRIRSTGFIYLAGVFIVAGFGALFIFYLKLGVIGMAMTIVANSYLSVTMSFWLLRRSGIRVNMIRIMKYAVYSAVMSLAAVGLVRLLPSLEAHLILRLLVSGSLFVGFVALSFLPLRRRLARIIHDT